MAHELTIWEPSFTKYVKRIEDGEVSPSYMKRQGVHKPDFAESRYECSCGEHFGTDRDAALDHLQGAA